MDSEQKRLFLAVALSAVVLFGWQAFFAPQYVENTTVSRREAPPIGVPEQRGTVRFGEAADPVVVEKKTIVRGESLLSLDSSLVIDDYKTPHAQFEFADVVGSKKALEVEVYGAEGFWKKINVSFEDVGGKLVGREDVYGVGVEIGLGEEGRTSFWFSSGEPLRYRVRLNSIPLMLDNGQSRRFISFSQDLESHALGEGERRDGMLKWFGLDFNYHLFAVIFPERVPLAFRTEGEGAFVVDTSNPMEAFGFDLLFAKKNYDLLESYGDGLHMAVDLGFFGIIGVPILRGLQWLYGYIPNYGVGIVLITLFIRILTFPLQYKSFKSMKKMQKIQPDMQRIREKFKDDPQRMQKETMELFKKAGANPLGGCLPLLLQMPILFAFYQVLYNAVELVGAPFVAHIDDLSVKDPFYILPVLCTLSMFLNQKLTPMAMTDPTQKKIMAFMPLLFGFIMKDLPSGLVLYIVVSTIFGIAQQLLVYRMAD